MGSAVYYCGTEPVTPENAAHLESVDSRLVALAQRGFIPMLIGSPKQLTKTLIAEFIGLTAGSLQQTLKAEKW